MLSDVMSEALNKQINRELYSGYLCLSLSAYFDRQTLPGFAHWMRQHAHEELAHAMKIYEFLVDRDVKITFKSVNEPPRDFDSPLEAARIFLSHETKGSKDIYNLHELAQSEKTYEVQPTLLWFIDAHTEEEKLGRKILDQLEMIGDDGAALLLLDDELGQRTGGAPPETSANDTGGPA
jgi:ferritin